MATMADYRSAMDRYSSGAIVLHWLMAAVIIVQLAIGLWMGGALANPATQALAYDAFQLHKSLGLLLLVLAVLRLFWRLGHRVPPMPIHMAAWQKTAARISHFLLYSFMILIPLSGWVYVSTGWNSAIGAPLAVPTMFFGLFEWPHVPGIANAAESVRIMVADRTSQIHEILAFSLIGLLVLHILAALKHHFMDQDDVLRSMLPFTTDN